MGGLYVVDDPGFHVHEEAPRNVLPVVGLIEEDVFSVVTLERELFEDSFVVDSVFTDELLPKFNSDYG